SACGRWSTRARSRASRRRAGERGSRHDRAKRGPASNAWSGEAGPDGGHWFSIGDGGPMTMTDPVADMLTRIRNANVAMHDTVRMPSSKLKEALAAILQREGYIEGWSAADDPTRPGRFLEIRMKYT